MPNLLTPLPFLDASGQPANGFIFAQASRAFATATGFVTTVQSMGRVVNGVFLTADDSKSDPFVLMPATVDAPLQLTIKLNSYTTEGRLQGGYTGVQSRTVTVADVGTVSWADLVDVVPVADAIPYEIQPWMQDAMDNVAAAEVAAGTATTKAAAAAASAASASASAASVVRGGANGVAPLDGASLLPDANLPTRLGVSGLATTIDGKVSGAAATELHTDFRSLPNGPVPTLHDTGQPFTYAAEPPTISAGAFTTPTPTTSGKATYLEAQLGNTLARVGAEFIIRRTSGGQTNGSLAMGAWSDPGVVATYPGAYPVAGAHFVINRDRWTYNFYADADSTDVGSKTFATPLPEGVPLTVEILFHGDRATIHLPDGTTATITDARVLTYVKTRAFWEPFMSAGSNNTNVGITRVWADSDPADSNHKYVTAQALATELAASPYEANTTSWRPTADQYVNLTTTQTELNANLYVDIVLPKSRKFVITATAALEKTTAAATPYWAFTANTSLTVGVLRLSVIAGVETITQQIYVDLTTETGFKAGTVLRIGWAQYKSGTDRITMQVGNGRWPTMTVTPVNGRISTVTP